MSFTWFRGFKLYFTVTGEMINLHLIKFICQHAKSKKKRGSDTGVFLGILFLRENVLQTKWLVASFFNANLLNSHKSNYIIIASVVRIKVYRGKNKIVKWYSTLDEKSPDSEFFWTFFPVFGVNIQISENEEQKKLRIQTYCTQCKKKNIKQRNFKS